MAVSLRASLVAFGLMLTPLAASAQQTVVITNLPPPTPLAEMATPPPGTGFAWVSGFWSWNGSQYNWTAGHWERPPQATWSWQSPQWEREGGRYRFHPGRWGGPGMPPTAQPVPMPMPPPAQPVPMAQPAFPSVPPPVQVPMGPPRPRFERRPPLAPAGQAWIPGHWDWNQNQWVWNAGHFEAPPQPQAQWIAPRVMRRGRRWQMNPGRWHWH